MGRGGGEKAFGSGDRGLLWFSGLCHRPQLPMEDRLEGAVALGTTRLGPGGDGGAAEASVAGMRTPRGRRSFQAHKGRAKSRRAQ